MTKGQENGKKSAAQVRKENLEKGKATQFKEGNPGGPGRPPMLLSQIRQLPGFETVQLSQVTMIIQDMLGLSLEQLQGVAQNPQSNVLIVSIASAICQGIKDGNLNTIETILSRAFGRANQKIQHEGIPSGSFKIEITRPKDEEEEESEQQT